MNKVLSLVFLQATQPQAEPFYYRAITFTLLSLAGIAGFVMALIKFIEFLSKWSGDWKEVQVKKINAQAVGLEAVEACREETVKLHATVKDLVTKVDTFRSSEEKYNRERWIELENQTRKILNDLAQKLEDRIETTIKLYMSHYKKF